MKINEETTVSEEQILFNKLNHEEQQFILRQMRLLQPCENLEKEKKTPEKLDNFIISVGSVDESNIEEYIQTLFEQQYKMFNKINSIIDYLKSKGE